jgi:hypothetical protein
VAVMAWLVMNQAQLSFYVTQDALHIPAP